MLGQIGIFLLIIVPPLLAGGLVSVSRPNWLGWAMWLVSAGVATYAWHQAVNQPEDFGRIVTTVFALWVSWPPILALVARLMRKRGAGPESAAGV